MSPSAKVVISGLEVFAYHGCTPEEKEEGQEFLIDIELAYDATKAVAADDLAEAVDYDRVASQVYDLATRERYDLIETLAARVGEQVMATTPATRLLVRVLKPRAPMGRKVGGVAVEMTFTRDGS